MKLHIRKGDNVMVVAGDSKGKSGKVLEVDTEKYRAIVENVNLATKHTKPNAKNPKGGLVKQEMPIHISNLMVVDSTGKPTRVGRQIDSKTNKSVRVSKKTGEVIK
ncbi:MAG: 50S ribosomal protein L24 [Bacteroidales bacterium]|nr:50S ribosomal protein L24 [Bacteroidales bacterium]